MAFKNLASASRYSSKFRAGGSLLEFLLMTSVIALAAGLGFGAAIRFGQPEPLSLLGKEKTLQSEQSFPPLPDWPSNNPKEQQPATEHP